MPIRHHDCTGDILGRRAARIVAVIGQRVHEGRQRSPLGIECEVRIERAYRLPRLVGRAGAVRLAVPIQEAVAGSCGDRGGQGNCLALWDLLLFRNVLSGRASGIVGLVGDEVDRGRHFPPLGVQH